MAAPPSTRLQSMLQTAVQTVQWTYSLFWQLCPQQGILVWGDGYYNGAIKTRKTIQPMEVSTEEASLQRSQQLRELYDSLSAGESSQQTRRPCAALSPEDLTESEWFYLMCSSFSFPPGVGLPGKAYAKRQHVWVTGANEVDSKVFSRAILAKSAHVQEWQFMDGFGTKNSLPDPNHAQTVVCIPLLDGVVELATTERVQEDLGLIQHVKSCFIDNHHPHQPPKPALSEQSTSNPAASLELARFHSPPVPVMYAPIYPSNIANQIDEEEEDDEDDDDDEEEEQEGEEEGETNSEAETGHNSRRSEAQNQGVAAAEPSELMQLEMSEDIRLGSPDDASNNRDSDFHLLAASQAGDLAYQQRRADSYRAESTHRWPLLPDPFNDGIQPPASGTPPLEELTLEDTHYSQTVSTIVQHQSSRWPEPLPTTSYILYSSQSAFSKWRNRSDHHLHVPVEGTSQCLLKHVLFGVPFLQTKYRDESPLKSLDASELASRFRKGTPQDELSPNHVLAERRRREKLNEKFIILRSLVPFATKMDKASILGDAIEYVNQLRKKIQDLEERARQMEADQPSRMAVDSQIKSSSLKSVKDKRKSRIVEESGSAKPKAVDSPPQRVAEDGGQVEVEVSIIESDALVELQCPYREGLLLDVMQMLLELRVEITTVQSSLTNGVFVSELRAKVKENVNGKKATILEVKKAIQQIIPP